MKNRVILAALVLALIGYLWWQRAVPGAASSPRRRIYTVPGVGRIQQAPDSEREYWRGVYERK